MDCLNNLDKCDAKCCKVLPMMLNNPTQAFLDYYQTHGCEIIRKSRTIYQVLIPNVCPQLENNKCKLHDGKKPYLCDRFGKVTDGYYIPDNCIHAKKVK